MGTYGRKLPLIQANKAYVKHKRLAPLLKQVEDFCITGKESKIDVLYFMLHSPLAEEHMLHESKTIQKLWSNRTASACTSMSVDECLAMRIESLQSISQYKSQYDIMQINCDNNPLQPPAKVSEKENQYMPYNMFSQLLNNDRSLDIDVICRKQEDPEDIMHIFKNLPKGFLPIPNCTGVRWNYADAIAYKFGLLMLPGNYARMLFEPENEKYFLSLIPDVHDMEKCSKH